MDINYDNTKNVFDAYIKECQLKIKNTFFKEDDLIGFYSLRNSLISSGKISIDSSVVDAIKFERLDMIDVKINHTMRVVEDVIKMAGKIGTPVDFNKVLKISALLHDIGRFEQATWNNSFNDACYKNVNGIANHAQSGYHILFTNGRIKEYGIDERLYPAIGSVVYNHSIPVLTGDLALKFKKPQNLDIDVLTGLKDLNKSEKVIVAALVQMVRDVDMLDIFYQCLTGELPIVKEYVDFDIGNDTIKDIAKYWDIDQIDLLKYNGIQESDLSKMSTIKIPVDKIDLRKLSVPQDIKDKFYNSEDIDLKCIRARRDWTFINGMWWRLNHFLNNISFTSNLQLLKEKNLIGQIYNKYPDKFKFLVKDAFDFAREELIKRKLEKNGSSIYLYKAKSL